MESNKEMSEKIELLVSCHNLPTFTKFEMSDLIVRIITQPRGKQPRVVGQTEPQNNCRNPSFKQGVTLDYVFEEQQILTFNVIAVLNKNEEVIIGSTMCSFPQILMASEEGLRMDLRRCTNPDSSILIKYSRSRGSVLNMHFKVKCINVKDIETFSKSDPFLKIYRPAIEFKKEADPEKIPADNWVLVHTTEHYDDNLNPDFKPFTINETSLNMGSLEMMNKWEIWDYSHKGKHTWISKAFVSARQLLSGEVKKLVTLDEKKKPAGDIIIENFKAVHETSMSDYLEKGVYLSLAVGIDFTGSNDHYKKSESLHYLGGLHSLNPYQTVLHEVGGILSDYDRDKLIPAYGFGAIPQGQRGASFCFPITLDQKKNELHSYQELVEAYNKIVPSLTFSSPALFAPIIGETLKRVEKEVSTNKMRYTILLIITDGIINDMDETISKIVDCSHLPMSIIIVGVGSDDFKQMVLLDGDKSPLKDSNGRMVARDIVHFLQFRNYAKNLQAFAKDVFQELPRQIDDYYQNFQEGLIRDMM